MIPTAIIALDPGTSGGIAWTLDSSHYIGFDPAIHCAMAMPDSQGGVLVAMEHHAVAYIEQVGGFIRPANDGKNSAAAHTMFTFGENYGFLKGVLQTLQLRLVLVHPKKWQKHFSLGAKKDCATPREWKAKLASEAQRRFPGHIVTRSTADALLILDYARSEEARLL